MHRRGNDSRKPDRPATWLVLLLLALPASCRPEAANEPTEGMNIELRQLEWRRYRGSHLLLRAQAAQARVTPRRGRLQATGVRVHLTTEVGP